MTTETAPAQPFSPEALRERFGALEARIASLASAEDWTAWFGDWDAFGAELSGERSRRSYRFTKALNDAEAEEEDRYFREEVRPIQEEYDARFVAAILGGEGRAHLSAAFSARLIEVMENDVALLEPTNKELRVEDSKLANEYSKLIGKATVEVDGDEMTLAKARSLTSNPDPAKRKAAYIATGEWFRAQRAALAGIFDKQVAIRQKMGRNLGNENFIPLGYQGMFRTDYGPEEAAVFRASVKRVVTPLYAEILAGRAAARGQEALAPWDMSYDPDQTLAPDVAEPIAAQLDKAGRVFQRLSPQLAEHFARMRQLDLIDLENRPGKAPGAYCTNFPDEKKVAIFCNSTGGQQDVSTLFHEMGHAFQGWESQAIDPVALRFPTLDACEIHSMGMEFLSLRHLDEFFAADDLARFRRYRWAKAIALLCYVCVVDEFQHRVYSEPSLSPDERDAVWAETYDQYIVGVDWSEAEPYRAVRWYQQLHLFHAPFYYIDYAIAEMGAMQLGMMDERDPAATMDTYMALCRLGGTKSVLPIFESAGMRSPFDPALMDDLMAHARKVLKG